MQVTLSASALTRGPLAAVTCVEHYSAPRGPLVRILADVPDWSVLDQAALQNAIGQLPVSLPLAGPGPPGISQ